MPFYTKRPSDDKIPTPFYDHLSVRFRYSIKHSREFEEKLLRYFKNTLEIYCDNDIKNNITDLLSEISLKAEKCNKLNEYIDTLCDELKNLSNHNNDFKEKHIKRRIEALNNEIGLDSDEKKMVEAIFDATDFINNFITKDPQGLIKDLIKTVGATKNHHLPIRAAEIEQDKEDAELSKELHRFKVPQLFCKTNLGPKNIASKEQVAGITRSNITDKPATATFIKGGISKLVGYFESLKNCR
jgi:polyhydroxyalkanoate synthesis regulator phasin